MCIIVTDFCVLLLLILVHCCYCFLCTQFTIFCALVVSVYTECCRGLPLAVAVHEANLHDSKGAPKVIERLAHKFPRLVKILANGGYQGDLADWMKKKFGWTLEVVLRPDECPSKFQVLPKRWIVERSFAWLDNFRRLTIDYEYLPDTAEAMVQPAFSKIIRKQPVNTVLI